MATWDEWWARGPQGRYVSTWERWYLDKFQRPPFEGKVVDALGKLNARYHPKFVPFLMYDEFKWDPLKYNAFNYFVNHPAATADLILLDFLESGLDFYVYLIISSLYVDYDFVSANDLFELYLPPSCFEQSVTINCKIVEPPQPVLKKHQVVQSWGLSFRFPCLALPVFLRIEPVELAKIKQIFDENEMNTLTFSLRHSYPQEEQAVIEDGGTEYFIKRTPTDIKLSNTFSHFFTFWKEKPRRIQLLVASDIHVAERFDVIQNDNIGIPPPDGDYCNYNEQARKLQKQALELWRRGEVDAVIFNGDLIDYGLKDSVDVEVNLKPTAEFNDAPKPFGMGERGIHLPSLLDSESDGYTALSSAPGGSANVERAANVLEMLGQGSTTNWQQFSAIFSPLMDCVRTFLVPGNHDYEVFGYEFMGISEDKFNEFIDAVADDTVESRHKTILDLLAAIIGSRSAAIDFLIALGGGLPDYQDVSQYKTTGLTQAQAKQYDDTKRALKSNFRALLSAFWAEQAVGGIHFGHNGDARADNSCHEIPSTSGIVRLGFLNSGPIYNHLVNTSPWLRGFPNKEKQTHQAIQNLQQWRDNDAFKDDTLIICMHAPPLTRIFPNTGVTYAAACFTMTPWSPDHEPANADDQSVWDDYKGECEFSNIWQARNFQDPDPDPPLDPVKDPVYAAPLHNHRALLMALSPKVYVGCHSHTGDHSWWEEVEEKIRQRPVLTLAGHTHWKHTYSIDRMTKGTPDYQGYRGCIHFHYGNELINELHEYADNNSADTWWKNRSLIVTTGCVGPIPSPDFKDQYTPVEPGDPGYTPPFESQGYYIVTIEDGVVTRINWNNLWYKN